MCPQGLTHTRTDRQTGEPRGRVEPKVRRRVPSSPCHGPVLAFVPAGLERGPMTRPQKFGGAMLRPHLYPLRLSHTRWPRVSDRTHTECYSDTVPHRRSLPLPVPPRGSCTLSMSLSVFGPSGGAASHNVASLQSVPFLTVVSRSFPRRPPTAPLMGSTCAF